MLCCSGCALILEFLTTPLGFHVAFLNVKRIIGLVLSICIFRSFYTVPWRLYPSLLCLILALSDIFSELDCTLWTEISLWLPMHFAFHISSLFTYGSSHFVTESPQLIWSRTRFACFFHTPHDRPSFSRSIASMLIVDVPDRSVELYWLFRSIYLLRMRA